jgi:ADP-ribosylglycohydrolase
LLGAILGDIIGSRFEFNIEFRKNKTEDFTLFTKDNYFTDDTVMTIATADAILNHKSFKECYLKWGKKYPDRGYGGYFRNWLHHPDPKPYGSFGNGSAMRVSPIGWLYDSYIKVAEKARESAECTHNHEEGIKGAQAVAICIFMANIGEKKDSIKQYIQDNYKYDLNKTLEEIRPSYRFDATCQGSVPESIICFLEGKSYEDVVRKAVSLGGDTDTMACIAGSIAEAYYEIPDEYIKYAYMLLPNDMIKIIDQFEWKKI